MRCSAMGGRTWGIAALALGISALVAQAQLVPWRVFADPDSTSVCDLVNAANVELVVLLNSDNLTIVTGADTDLVNTEVLNSGEVLIDGDSFGFIEFATDDEGFRTLWWLSLTGRVIEVDGITGAPSESEFFPSDFANVPCDACPFWDDGEICTCISDSECDDFDECTIDDCDQLNGCSHIPVVCEVDDRCATAICDPNEGCLVVDLREECDDGDECTVDDLCVDGECIGLEAECDDNDPCTDDLCDSELGCIFTEVLCDDDNECTDETCVAGLCVTVDNLDRCNDGDSCTSNDRCRDGTCSGTPIENCDDDGGGPVIVLCGNNAALTMMLTFSGLVATGALRRRRSN